VLTPDDPSDVVARGYDRVAKAYAALERGDAWPRMNWVHDVLDRLPPGSRVLDIGCGSGIPATRELAREHVATGVDVSARQIELARQCVPHTRFIHGDILSCTFPESEFDAVVALYVLDHVPRERHAELLRRIAWWLKPGGLLLFTVETEDSPDTVAEWLGVDMYFSCYDEQTTRAIVESVGFEIVRHAIESQDEGGHEVAYLWVLARTAPNTAAVSERVSEFT
jgi:SAM-dependent methyltransferase